MTSDSNWDSSVLEDNKNWFDTTGDNEKELELWDKFGNYKKRFQVSTSSNCKCNLSKLVDKSVIFHTFCSQVIHIDDQETCEDGYVKDKPVNIQEQEPDYSLFKPLFAWLPEETIKKTWELTTQYARIPMSIILKKHYKASHPALNVRRRDEDIATDSVFSNMPAVDCGVKCTQFFIGRKTLVSDVYLLKSVKQFLNTLEDQIKERGAPN